MDWCPLVQAIPRRPLCPPSLVTFSVGLQWGREPLNLELLLVACAQEDFWMLPNKSRIKMKAEKCQFNHNMHTK